MHCAYYIQPMATYTTKGKIKRFIKKHVADFLWSTSLVGVMFILLTIASSKIEV